MLDEASDDFRFASAVAAYGMILRNSEYRGAADYDMVCTLAGSATGPEGTMREARKFLEDGDKVQFTVIFRGRELARTDLGTDPLKRVATILEDVAKIEKLPHMAGRPLHMIVAKK